MHAPRLLTVALAVLSLGVAFPAAAQAPNDTGKRLAHAVFSALDMPNLVRQSAMQNGSALAAFEKVRPAWKELFVQAMQEGLAKDQGDMEAALGRIFTRDYSDAELTAALAVFSDPQARMAIAAAARHEPAANGQTCSPACLRAMNSPAGRSFLTKFSKTFSERETLGEIMATVIPDVFILFGEKAKAAESKGAAGL